MYYLDDDALVSGHEAAPNSDNKDAERQENKGKGPDKEGILGHRGSKPVSQCTSLVRETRDEQTPLRVFSVFWKYQCCGDHRGCP